MEEHTLIANSGIQLITFPLVINTKDKYKMWYHEWYESDNAKWHLELVQELKDSNDENYFYKKKPLYDGGYLADDITMDDLKRDNIFPLKVVEDSEDNGYTEGIFDVSFLSRNIKFDVFENVWLPIPYFFKKTPKRFDFGPLNWSRMMLLPLEEADGLKKYNVLLAFDTRTKYQFDDYKECPVFPDVYRESMDFELCSNEFLLMDYCHPNQNWSYIDAYLLHLVHPEIQNVCQIKGQRNRRMSYIASYIFLISYLAKNGLLPSIKLYKNLDVDTKDVDMVVDVGNSRTTALLIEDNLNFNQVRPLELIDYTNLIKEIDDSVAINKHDEPFDMRLVFRKVDFGNFGIKDSKQFIYPSLVRLGNEANSLIHLAANQEFDNIDTLSTYSSPKRYLWDWTPSRGEWKFLILEGEQDEHILNLRGITNQIKSDGRIDPNGGGGTSFHYSRRSLMTFAFLEMIVQAMTQINGEEYRSKKTGFGGISIPRRICRIIVTCPTAMSKVEREALIGCVNDAVLLFRNFDKDIPTHPIEIIPTFRRDEEGNSWYYDEATCSQLVYMYGEVGHKYKGCCSEFFELYGKVEEGDTQPSITIGSLDIGAGTSDLMISKYDYIEGDITTITPNPKFYDSYYFAGDDMLHALIKNVMLLDTNSSFRKKLSNLSMREYRQKIKDFFGKDYSGQTALDRTLRKDFNIQYSVPLMCHFLELLKQERNDCVVHYSDVFANCPPSGFVIEGFKTKMGIDITTLDWKFDRDLVYQVVFKEFEPLLKKIATIVYSRACDIVLLSGRPASLPVIRDIFLKYYSVSPNRLIVLNDYYVGDWYPFSENTGYIRNAKTIVAMGGVLGHYASEFSNLNKFMINLESLKENLKSTVNFISVSSNGYLISPNKPSGELIMSNTPTTLNVRQVGMESYPSRMLYSIDFNIYKISDRIRKRYILQGEKCPTDAKVMSLVKEVINELKRRMPFKVTIERDVNDTEELIIASIIDKNGNDVKESDLELHIQSLGVHEHYWLDSGAFDF